jgi:pyruvate dehydrogenase E2 component (dihydrolipoamide acetyltransferase)
MARTFNLPDLGEGIHEGEIIEILVSVGDEIEEGDDLLVVETDKASVEIPSPYTGEVTGIEVEPGDLVHVGDTIITFSGGEEEPEKEAEEAPPETEQPPEGTGPEAGPEAEAEAEAEAEKEGAEEPGEGEPQSAEGAPKREGPVPASPSTRRLARELSVDLHEVPPTGPAGRVTSQDVRAFAEKAEEEEVPAPAEEARPEAEMPERPLFEIPEVIPRGKVPSLPDFTRWGEVKRVPLRSVRRATAKQMALAWSQIPHVNHQDKADITELEHFRRRNKERIEEQGGKLTPTVFAIKAVVAALKEHPRFNASLDPESEEIILKQYYHVGIAVDTDRGLLVPVIRDVDRKSITELSVELYEIAQRTRSGEASLDELQGGTFTITNIGILGGTAFFPIINFPEVAILGMARARWEPIMRRSEAGEFETEPRYVLPLMLAFDHRVADGADAARFVGVVKKALETPENMLLMM